MLQVIIVIAVEDALGERVYTYKCASADCFIHPANATVWVIEESVKE